MSVFNDWQFGLLTIEEAADLLKCSRQTVRDRIKSGEIAGDKYGRQWRIKAEDLNNYINKGNE